MLNGHEMVELGYALQDNSFGSRAKAPYWVARSGVDLLAHYYELWRSRGLDYVRGMARNSWRRAGHLAKR